MGITVCRIVSIRIVAGSRGRFLYRADALPMAAVSQHYKWSTIDISLSDCCWLRPLFCLVSFECHKVLYLRRRTRPGLARVRSSCSGVAGLGNWHTCRGCFCLGTFGGCRLAWCQVPTGVERLESITVARSAYHYQSSEICDSRTINSKRSGFAMVIRATLRPFESFKCARTSHRATPGCG